MRRKQDLSSKSRADRGKQVTPPSSIRLPAPPPLLSFQLKVNDEGIQQRNTDQEMWMYVERVLNQQKIMSKFKISKY